MTTPTTTTPNAYDLSRDCTLVGVSVGLYSWSSKDKVAAAAAADRDTANSERYSAYIQRLSKEDRLPPQQIAGEARKILEFPNGTPWDGKGFYLIPNTRLESTLEKLEAIRHRFYTAVDELIARLPELESKARADLNGAFDRLGFPTAGELREKYSFAIRQSAIVNPEDLRLNHVSPRARVAIEEGIRKEQAEQVRAIHKAAVEGIEAALRRVVESLPAFSDGKISRFEDTLITGLDELAEALPALNITKDRAIDATLHRIRGLSSKLHESNKAGELRKKDDTGTRVRKVISTEARGILAALKSGAVTDSIR